MVCYEYGGLYLLSVPGISSRPRVFPEKGPRDIGECFQAAQTITNCSAFMPLLPPVSEEGRASFISIASGQ